MPRKASHAGFNPMQVFSQSNRALGIIGRFTADDWAAMRRHVFDNTGTKTEHDGTISATEWFRLLKPELRVVAQGILNVGGQTFNSYDFGTPAELGAQGQSQPILIDSPLLNDDAYTQPVAEKIQMQGGRLFKRLLDDLHVLSQFWHSAFPRALLKIAKHYLLLYANSRLESEKNKKTKDIIDDAQWYELIAAEHGLSAALVKFLTAFAHDEGAALSQFKRALSEASEARTMRMTPQQHDLLAEGLTRCKAALLMDKEPASDAVLGALAEDQAFRFLRDYPADSAYGIQDIEGVGDKRFGAYYARFINASDDVHRFVRTQALHSYLFCFLASKYQAHSQLQIPNAARVMYATGVEGQGDKRIPAESREDREKNNEIIDQAEPESAIPAGENYQDFDAINTANMKELLSVSRMFTTKALRERLQRLFTKIAQIAGGKAGQLLDENARANLAHVKFYRAILNTRESKDRAYDLDLFRTRLERLCLGANAESEKAFVKAFLDKVSVKDKPAPAELRRRVKEEFVRRFAIESKTRFAKSWLANQAKIDADEKLFLNLYDFRLGLEVASSAAEAGAPGMIVSLLTIPDLDDDKALKDQRQESLEREAASQSNGDDKPAPIGMGMPGELAKLDQPAGAKLPVKHGPKKIGELEIADANRVVFHPTHGSIGALLEHPKTEIVMAKGRRRKMKLTELGDIPQFSDFIAAQKETAVSSETLKKHDELSRTQDKVRAKYVSRTDASQELNRGLRALLFGEYIYGAPKDSVHLDQADLSCILGLMVDMVEQIGDRRLGDKLTANAPTDELTELLKTINLSQYYPVADANELSSILTYHYTLCKKLNDVQSYLREIGEIKRFMESIKGSDLRVVFINDTLEEHSSAARASSQLIVSEDAPALIYLTGQSGATAEALAQFAKRVARAVGETANAPKAQVPILVSADESLDLSQAALPTLTPSNVPLPRVTSKENGDRTALVASKVIQEKPYLLLCASILAPGADFGQAGSIVADQLNDMLAEQLGVKLTKEERLGTFLRRAWLQPGTLLSHLIFSRWLNIVGLAKRRTNADFSMSSEFSAVLEKIFKDEPGVHDEAFRFIARPGDSINGKKPLPVCVVAAAPDPELTDESFDLVENFGGKVFSIGASYGTRLADHDFQFTGLDWTANFQQLLAQARV